MVTDIISRLISDSRREKPTNDVKAKYQSIAEKFDKFDWASIKDGTSNVLLTIDYFA